MNFFSNLPLSSYFPTLLHAAGVTLGLTVVTYALALVLATATALGRFYRTSPVSYTLSTIYVEGTRNVPSLVLLYLVYFGAPQFGIRLSNYVAGVLVLTWTIAAYLGEALRGALEAIPKGQWEASSALALSWWQTVRRIALPQMYRDSWPSLVNYLMLVLFGTSLLSTINVPELTQVAGQINSESFQPFQTYAYVFVLYYVISSALQFLSGRFRLVVDPRSRQRRRRRWAS